MTAQPSTAMDFVFVGAGRLATQLSKALLSRGHRVVAVYSRTMASAEALAASVGATATDSLDALPLQADAFILAVKDTALPVLAPRLAEGRQACTFFHTAGSMPMTVLDCMRHHGVIYPMQTFSKERDVDFAHVPFFIEGNSDEALALASRIAGELSDNVRQLPSHERRFLHLAAVFACNFANHCYALSAAILERHGLPFDVMLPLIDETARKVHTMHPLQAQTGPAVRYDENVISAQEQLLADAPMAQQVYRLMSRSIHEQQASNERQ